MEASPRLIAVAVPVPGLGVLTYAVPESLQTRRSPSALQLTLPGTHTRVAVHAPPAHCSPLAHDTSR